MKFTKAARLEERNEEFLEIPVNQIYPNPYQPRKYFKEDALRELSNSILQYGLLQPISVRKTANDRYELIAGERRLRACKMAGLKYIKAIVTYMPVVEDVAMAAMIENIERENLNFFEEAEGYLALMREHGLTQESLAKKLSKNQSTIANKLRILRLPRTVKERILRENLTERHARALLRLHNEEAQLRLIERIAGENLSVKETEELVVKELKKLYGEEKPEDPGKVIKLKCNYNIYINTVRKTVEKISEAGIPATFNTEETKELTRIIIELKK